jgi:hypothetical protein
MAIVHAGLKHWVQNDHAANGFAATLAADSAQTTATGATGARLLAGFFCISDSFPQYPGFSGSAQWH